MVTGPHYDVEYPLQIHGFDPNFHFVGMTFNPEVSPT
jgi:hypothetical protein